MRPVGTRLWWDTAIQWCWRECQCQVNSCIGLSGVGGRFTSVIPVNKPASSLEAKNLVVTCVRLVCVAADRLDQECCGERMEYADNSKQEIQALARESGHSGCDTRTRDELITRTVLSRSIYL